jgi:hypothetical protein
MSRTILPTTFSLTRFSTSVGIGAFFETAWIPAASTPSEKSWRNVSCSSIFSASRISPRSTPTSRNETLT